MASIQTLESLGRFVNFGYYLKIFPMKLSPNSNIMYVVNVTKKYIAATSFSVTVNTLIILAYLHDLIVNNSSMENKVTGFILGIISMALTILGAQIWFVFKMESLLSLTNTFNRFNLRLCKFPQVHHALPIILSNSSGIDQTRYQYLYILFVSKYFSASASTRAEGREGWT